MHIATEIRRTLKLAAPIMGAQFLHIVMLFVDNLMVGRLGAVELGGLALAGAFYSFIFVIVIGVMGALSALVSEADGAGQFQKAAVYARQGVLLSLGITVVIVAGLFAAEPILLTMGQQPEPSRIAAEYLTAMVWTVPAQLSFFALRNFTEGTDDSLPSVIVAIIAALLNIPLDYALIFGAWGMPELGVAGAGYATAILNWLSLALLVAYVASRKRYRKYELFRAPKIDTAAMKEIIAIGVPLGGAVATEMGFFVTTTFLMGLIGAVELAAHQVALNAASMVFMLPLGLSFAVSIRVGSQLGKKDRAGAATAWKASLVITGVLQVVTAVIFLVFPGFIVDLYDQENQVRDLAIQLLRIAGFFQLFDGFQVVGMGTLRGLKDTRFAFMATLFAFWVCGISVVVWQFQAQNPTGLWAGLLVGLGVASVIHHTRARHLLKAQ